MRKFWIGHSLHIYSPFKVFFVGSKICLVYVKLMILLHIWWDYSHLKKSNKLATLEYQKCKKLQTISFKRSKQFKDPNHFLNRMSRPRKSTCKSYCIPESVHPNMVFINLNIY
ncbi:hypothetical protein ACTFIW_002941 [Dictyostelium discoideum]